MSEITPPPFDPNQLPPIPPPPAPGGKGKPPGKVLCTFLGFLLFIITCGMAYFFPPAPAFGFVAAIVCLFFKDYRCVFLGYILTCGILLLAAIIYCFTQPFHID
jgi:hypothetical protein